ncbi:MAG: sigma-54-dependent transcriptional regulator [Candidatus Anammoxibacter sp.]
MIDDEIHTLESFEMALRSEGIDNIIACQDSRSVLTILSEQNVGIILLDLSMPDVTGEELLSVIPQKFPDILVVVTTGINETETAVKCMKSGAFDYIVKPIAKAILVAVVKRAIDTWELKNENSLLRQHVLSGKLEKPNAFSEIITVNKTMLAIFQYIESIAVTSQPVLITGETGVGKELIAKIVHDLSKREGSFIPVNVGGLDDNVISDTLFGHVKGAFTGAHVNRKGLIEMAAGGTLFLDEIGDLGNTSQVKLLRLLQEHEYRSIGADVIIKSKARIIVATNKDLQSLQRSGKFRKDLYYRLRAHHIFVPPLRDRLDDLPLLLNYFLQNASERLGKKKPTPPPELLTLLSTYNFPGNIRELQSMVFDAVSNHKSRMISLEVFKSWMFNDKSIGSADSSANYNCAEMEDAGDTDELLSYPSKLPTLKHAAQSLINEAMKRSCGNQNIAAKQLGISRQALNKRLKTFNNR